MPAGLMYMAIRGPSPFVRGTRRAAGRERRGDAAQASNAGLIFPVEWGREEGAESSYAECPS